MKAGAKGRAGCHQKELHLDQNASDPYLLFEDRHGTRCLAVLKQKLDEQRSIAR